MKVYRDELLLRHKQCQSEDSSVCTIVLQSHAETVTIITEHTTMVFSEFYRTLVCMHNLAQMACINPCILEYTRVY